MAIEVLKGRKKGLTAAQVKDAILEKYPHRNSESFYNQVFIALDRTAGFKKVKGKRYLVR